MAPRRLSLYGFGFRGHMAPYRPLAEATAVRLPQLAFILRRCRAPPERRSPATPPGCRPFVKRTSLGAIGVGAYRSGRPLTRK